MPPFRRSGRATNLLTLNAFYCIISINKTTFFVKLFMNFFAKVYFYTKKIPKGKVASYGQIAALCGSPRAARQVGWALHLIPSEQFKNIPWHRVINSKGYISTTCPEHTPDLQKQMLQKEGVKVVKKKGLWWVDLDKYLWQL